MSNVQEYACFLKQHFHPQLVFPELANQLGLDESIVLQQVHYWLEKGGKSIDGDIWIYNTYDQWKQQFTYWSISKIKRIFYTLEKAELIISRKINVRKSNHTKWYSINYKKLYELMKGMMPKKEDKRKKFASVQNELSSSQSDTIINTETNYTNIISLSNDNTIEQETTSKQRLAEIKTDRKIFQLGNEEKEVCQKMLAVWNEVFINSKEKIVLTDKRGGKLYQIWNKTCDQNIEKWRVICLAINSSKFLMGEKGTGFKAYFDWIIKESTISRILAGEFSIGDRIPDIKQAEMAIKAKQEQEVRLAMHEAERIERAEKVRQLEIEQQARLLVEKELAVVEASWDESEKGRAMEEFKDFLSRGGEGEECFKDISEDFQKHGKFTYAPVVIDFFFSEFKIIAYLKKSWVDFMEEAEVLLNSGSFAEADNTVVEVKINREQKGDVAKMEAENKEKLEKERERNRKFDLEVEAQRLAEEELERIEATWDKSEKERAINEFEDFINRGGEGNPTFAYLSENYRKKGWIAENGAVIDSYFREFKISKYLKKTWDDFVSQARNLLPTMRLVETNYLHRLQRGE